MAVVHENLPSDLKPNKIECHVVVVAKAFLDKHIFRRISEYRHLTAILPHPRYFTAQEFLELEETILPPWDEEKQMQR